MHADGDDVDEPDFDDMGPEDWEERFSLYEPDDALDDFVECEDEELQPVEDANDIERPRTCLSLLITSQMYPAAMEEAARRVRGYPNKNEFGSGSPIDLQRRGTLGEMVYAQVALGDWRSQTLVQPYATDFGYVEVKASKKPQHRDIWSLSLIDSESRPGVDPTKHPLYVFVVIDELHGEYGRAYVMGWCSGDELWSGGKSPVPGGHGILGYQLLASLLHPMSTLVHAWDRLESWDRLMGRRCAWPELRPDCLGGKDSDEVGKD